MPKLFVYDTLMRSSLLQKVLGHPITGQRAYVMGYSEFMVPYDGQEWPSIAPDANSVVSGELFDIDGQDAEKLEDWESEYIPIQVVVNPGHVEATAYMVDPLRLRKKEPLSD